MSNSVDKYVEFVKALEMNTPETPYEIVMDEFSDDISDKIIEGGRYVTIKFLGYGEIPGAKYSNVFSYAENNTQKYLSSKLAGIIKFQEKNYFLANMPEKMIFLGNYYTANGDYYDLVENPENPDSFTAAEFLKTNYPKFSNNPYIVGLTYFTLNTTSDYRNMFDNCENLNFVIFMGPCDNRYDTLQKSNLVVNCPKLRVIGIADNDMVEILEDQRIESLITLIVTYQVTTIPKNVSVGKLGIRPFSEIDVTGKTDDLYIETRIAEYPFFMGNVKGSTEENPVSVIITDTENLQRGIKITD